MLRGEMGARGTSYAGDDDLLVRWDAVGDAAMGLRGEIAAVADLIRSTGGCVPATRRRRRCPGLRGSGPDLGAELG